MVTTKLNIDSCQSGMMKKMKKKNNKQNGNFFLWMVHNIFFIYVITLNRFSCIKRHAKFITHNKRVTILLNVDNRLFNFVVVVSLFGTVLYRNADYSAKIVNNKKKFMKFHDNFVYSIVLYLQFRSINYCSP